MKSRRKSPRQRHDGAGSVLAPWKHGAGLFKDSGGTELKVPVTVYKLKGDESEALPIHPFTFPGGEPHAQFDPAIVKGERIWIDARIGSMQDFGHLLAVADAIGRCSVEKLAFFIPYFPGARQDRYQPGAPFTLHIYSFIVKMMGGAQTVVVDPHNLNTLRAHLPYVSWINAGDLLFEACPMKFDGLICPDDGARKRTERVASDLHIDTIVHAHKHRDPATGKLSGFSCDPLPGPGQYLVVDDICDGGGTFIGLSEELAKDQYDKESTFHLYVTHGIFSKGTKELLKHFQTVISTDSFVPHAIDAGPRLKTIKLFPFAHEAMKRTLGT